MARPVVAVDVDEVSAHFKPIPYLIAATTSPPNPPPPAPLPQVLCEFLRPLVQYHNDHVGVVTSLHPPRKLVMSDFRSYTFRASRLPRSKPGAPFSLVL